MKLAIISDTHDNMPNLKKTIDWIRKEKIKTVIHCGDIFKLETIREGLKGFQGKIYLIFSPADASFSKIPEDSFKKIKNARIYSEFGEFKKNGRRIAFCHFPEIAERLIFLQKYDLVFYGHTHKPWKQTIGKTRLINPGNLTGIFYKPTFAVYDTKADRLDLKILQKLRDPGS